MRRAWLAVIVSLGALLAPARARAEESEAPDSLIWDDAHWRRIHPAEHAVTGTMLAGVGVGLLWVPQRVDKVQGGFLFDDWMRERMVLGNRADRDTARLVGDIFYWGMSAYPVAVDLGVAALAVHWSPDVAWQMFWIDAQALALTGLISTYTQRLVGRNRPFADRCAADPEYDDECDDPESRSQSLISGHTAMAFTGAALVCVHHQHLPLYGGGAPDLIACTTSIAGASVVALSRIVGDRHYVSDALAGMTVGFVSGYLIPELLHYRFRGSPFALRKGGVSAMILPVVTPTSSAVALTGFF
jgi:membrane-associated phospholipid phosphatase